tara:strand:+ start:2219 stop:2437 length:219 start_codon:yes stop_codon:yes gene_type:complete
MDNKGKTSNICYGGGFYTGSFQKTSENNVKINNVKINNVKINKVNIDKMKMLYEKFINAEDNIYKMKNILYS